MVKKYYYKECFSYQMATEMTRRELGIKENDYIDLSRYAHPILSIEIECFINCRCLNLSLAQMREEQFYIEKIGEFLFEQYPEMEDFLDQDETRILKDLLDWITPLRWYKMQTEYKRKYKKSMYQNLGVYLETIFEFFNEDDERDPWEKDKWIIEKLNINCRNNPINPCKILNFTKIKQRQIRREVKEAVKIWIKYLALSTIKGRIIAFNKFSAYLDEYHKDVVSMGQIRREIIEEYLIYRKTNYPSPTGLKNEVIALKELCRELSAILENPAIGCLFLDHDIPSCPRCSFKVYSEEEQKQWIQAIKYMNEQTGRAFLLHQLLGTRISETLTLQQDCLEVKDGTIWVTIHSIKSNTYRKPITFEIKQLIEKSINYTREKYAVSKYIFVKQSDPNKPMTYNAMRSQLEKTIKKLGMKSADNIPFSPKTHIFRHCYGVMLTEDHVEDAIIAKLLGHANESSVKFYRRIGGKVMAEETRNTRKKMDAVLTEIVKNWEGFEDLTTEYRNKIENI